MRQKQLDTPAAVFVHAHARMCMGTCHQTYLSRPLLVLQVWEAVCDIGTPLNPVFIAGVMEMDCIIRPPRLVQLFVLPLIHQYIKYVLNTMFYLIAGTVNLCGGYRVIEGTRNIHVLIPLDYSSTHLQTLSRTQSIIRSPVTFSSLSPNSPAFYSQHDRWRIQWSTNLEWNTVLHAILCIVVWVWISEKLSGQLPVNERT